MLIFPNLKKIFVHIPRTSGNRLCDSILAVYPNAVRLRGSETHMPIWKVREVFPGYETFSICRDYVEIFISHFNFCKWIVEQGYKIPNVLRDYALTCGISDINQHIQFCINSGLLCKFGGFTHTYLDENTKIFAYRSKPYNEISKYLGIDFTMLDTEYEYIDTDSINNIDIHTHQMLKHFCWMDLWTLGFK